MSDEKSTNYRSFIDHYIFIFILNFSLSFLSVNNRNMSTKWKENLIFCIQNYDGNIENRLFWLGKGQQPGCYLLQKKFTFLNKKWKCLKIVFLSKKKSKSTSTLVLDKNLKCIFIFRKYLLQITLKDNMFFPTETVWNGSWWKYSFVMWLISFPPEKDSSGK